MIFTLDFFKILLAKLKIYIYMYMDVIIAILEYLLLINIIDLYLKANYTYEFHDIEHSDFSSVPLNFIIKVRVL